MHPYLDLVDDAAVIMLRGCYTLQLRYHGGAVVFEPDILTFEAPYLCARFHLCGNV
jgi:hypothetical protein